MQLSIQLLSRKRTKGRRIYNAVNKTFSTPPRRYCSVVYIGLRSDRKKFSRERFSPNSPKPPVYTDNGGTCKHRFASCNAYCLTRCTFTLVYARFRFQYCSLLSVIPPKDVYFEDCYCITINNSV